VPIALALAGAILYGAADFFGGLASKRSPTAAVVAWSQGIGFALLAIAVVAIGSHPAASDLAWGAFCGVFGALGVALLYRGLAIGTMGVVSPITAVLAAAIPVLYGVVVRGERPSLLADAGIVAALLAVVCVSAASGSDNAPTAGTAPQPPARRASKLPPGLLEALGSGVGFGAFFICLAQTRPEAGVVPILAARCTSAVLIVAGGALVSGPASLRVERGGWPAVLACGAFDVSANVMYVLAIHSGGMLAVVAVLTSLYPASTVALAAAALHERLERLQWIGVALAFGGAVAIALPR
jgi:drug/metabolite transporter (DMT)-like permease